MSVVIEPSEELLFHIKTTAPKQYCVKPNAGRVEPNSSIEVQIILQPFKEEPAEDYKCKDKFLVQTAAFNNSLEQQDISSMASVVVPKITVSKEIDTNNDILLALPKALPPKTITVSMPAGKAPTEPLPPTPVEEKREKKELKEALEKIKSLEKELEQLQINQKTVLTSATDHVTVQSIEEGYSPQALMSISFLVFIFTYLFF
ncbi:hypothetical protein G6F66_001398 [Rhizopus arrhizus]|nr:hypothetical protein G6F66_001398 [Rhizopus arrhizus]